MKIKGWIIQTYTNEYANLGWIKKDNPVEFGNSPVRDKEARLAYIAKLVSLGETFTVTAIED